MIRAENIAYQIGHRRLLSALSLELQPGRILGIVGPNGAGKTTLMRLLSGELAPSQGSIALNGRAMAAMDAQQRARFRAVLPQAESLRFPFEVRQVVALGRYPWGGGASPADIRAVDEVIALLDLQILAQRHYTQLSGGERARVQCARVLCQLWPIGDGEPRYLLLDEPTANLDLSYQHQLLSITRECANKGLGVAMILHDLNHAMQVCDEVLILKRGEVEAYGATREVLTRACLKRTFGLDFDLISRPGSTAPWIAAIQNFGV